MLNSLSLETIALNKGACGIKNFCKPLYESYCFSRIPGTILQLLGLPGNSLPNSCFHPGPYERVVVFLIDGFGWEFLQKNYAAYPFLKRFFEEGIVSQLTSQFPSTTAAHLTTLYTGLEVGQSGIIDWFYCQPDLNRIISPLLFSYAGDQDPETLKIPANEIFPKKNIFWDLKIADIESYVFMNDKISASTYSKWMFRFSTIFSYDSFEQGLQFLKNHSNKKGVFYLYYGDIDACSHRYGIESEKTKSNIADCFHSLERFFCSVDKSFFKNTACILTADHGMTPVFPQKTLYLNQEIPALCPLLKLGTDQKPLSPAGSCRNYALHVKENHLEEALHLLSDKLKDVAYICPTQMLIEQGFFGKLPHVKDLLHRTGNITILPFAQEAVWWHEKNRFEQNFFGMHGGLSPSEMETIFLFQSF